MSFPLLSRKDQQARDTLALKLIRHIYHAVTKTSMSLSNEYRKSLGKESTALTYGEIVPESFLQILQLCHKPRGGTFVDLGCGVGKANFVAALSSIGFDKVWGIEIVPDLVLAAESVRELLSAAVESAKVTPIHSPSSSSAKLETGTGNYSLELVEAARVLILESETRSLPADALVNALCLSLGHKKYKSLLKPYKSFKKFLAVHSIFCTDPSCSISSCDRISCTESIDAVANADVGPVPIPPAAIEDHGECPELVLAKLLDKKAMDLLLPLPEIVFDEGDIFIIPWWEQADVVYVASLLFTEDMMRKLTLRASKMKSGSWIVTLSALLIVKTEGEQERAEEDHDEIRRIKFVSESFFKMSWHMAKVYFYNIRDV
jgi:Histone methylation protein DOT1